MSEPSSPTRITPRTTTVTGICLLALWALSWGLSYVDLGGWTTFLAFAIAAVKVALVVLFFMEIAVEKTSVQAALIAGLSMIAILVGFMVADVATRDPSEIAPPLPLHARAP